MVSYVAIRNKDNKQWIIPTWNTKTALALYQPSSQKGNLIKNLLPLIVKIPILKRVCYRIIRAQECDLDIPDAVATKIRDLFGCDGLTLSYFSGTPSIHQKEIIQIAKGKNIIGYVKYSKSDDIKRAFVKESTYLKFLFEKRVKNVPQSLFCSDLSSEMGVFVQDTNKTLKYEMAHELDEPHINFLRSFCEKTKVTKDFCETDYFKMLKKLRTSISTLSYLKNKQTLLNRTIELVENALNNTKNFCCYHGDFTPWNTYLLNNELFVFDFEYAESSYPPYLDVFHFFTQTLIWEKDYDIDDIMVEYKKQFIYGKFKNLFSNSSIAYIEYLLFVITLFSNRDGENLKDDDFRNMKIWLGLIEKLL